MRRNKHNIQIYYRTRLFGYIIIMRKEKNEFTLTNTKLFDIDNLKKRCKKQGKKKVRQLDSLHGIGRLI